jgi:scyllo-inositol 2-dehydrogenase (NADP+)
VGGLDLGSHLVDQALCLFGTPQTVWADLATQRPGGAAVDYAHLVLGYGPLRVLLTPARWSGHPDPGSRCTATAGRSSRTVWTARSPRCWPAGARAT